MIDRHDRHADRLPGFRCKGDRLEQRPRQGELDRIIAVLSDCGSCLIFRFRQLPLRGGGAAVAAAEEHNSLSVLVQGKVDGIVAGKIRAARLGAVKIQEKHACVAVQVIHALRRDRQTDAVGTLFADVKVTLIPLDLIRHVQRIVCADIPVGAEARDIRGRSAHPDLACLLPVTCAIRSIVAHTGRRHRAAVGFLEQPHKGIGVKELDLEIGRVFLHVICDLFNGRRRRQHASENVELPRAAQALDHAVRNAFGLLLADLDAHICIGNEGRAIEDLLARLHAALIDDAIRRHLAVRLLDRRRDLAGIARDQEAGDIKIKALVGGKVMVFPELQRRLHAVRHGIALRPHGIQIAGAVIAGDKIVVGSRRFIEVIEHMRDTVGQIRADRPGQRKLAARFIVPQKRQAPARPGGRVIVAHIEHDILRVLVVNRRIRSALVVALPEGIRQRDLAEYGGVRNARHAVCVGVHLTVVFGDDVDHRPFGSNVAHGGLRIRGGRVLHPPGNEAADREDIVARLFCLRAQDGTQRRNIRSDRLLPVVDRCDGRIRGQIPEERFLCNVIIRIRQHGVHQIRVFAAAVQIDTDRRQLFLADVRISRNDLDRLADLRPEPFDAIPNHSRREGAAAGRGRRFDRKTERVGLVGAHLSRRLIDQRAVVVRVIVAEPVKIVHVVHTAKAEACAVGKLLPHFVADVFRGHLNVNAAARLHDRRQLGRKELCVPVFPLALAGLLRLAPGIRGIGHEHAARLALVQILLLCPDVGVVLGRACAGRLRIGDRALAGELPDEIDLDIRS